MTRCIGHIGGRKAATLPGMLLALLTLALFAAPVRAQDNAPPANNAANAEAAKEEAERARAEAEAEPDPNDPITVDFVKKDIHTVMHYIALRSGLQIIVEGTITAELTVMYRKVLPKDAIRSICKANELEYVEDGNFIIIKKRRDTAAGLANVVKGDADGRYNVAFESQELVAAIMEVAKVTQTPVFVPTVPQGETESPGPRTDDQEAQQERRIQRIQERRISMYMRNADPDAILKRLADVGALKVTKNEDGYYYDYLKVIDPDGDTGFDPNASSQVKIVTRDYVLPGVDVNSAKGELTNLLSPRGKIVIDRDSRVLMVTDREEIVAQIDAFLTRVGALALERERLASEIADDPMVVLEIPLVRDTGDQALQTTLAQILTADGRVSLNPETNSVVVMERRSRMDSIKKFIAGLDTMPQQVLISARLVEVSLESYMGYGLQLFSSQPVDSWKDGVATGSSRDTTQGTAGGLFGNPTGFTPFVGTFVNQVIDARLELLANDGKVKTLSQPTQMVSNRKRARIEVGQEIPYVQSTSTGTGTGTQTASVTFREVSIVMEVQPTIFEGGIVRLQVTVTVREVVGNTAIEGNNTPVLSLRESQTDVYMRDGETMVMGGLLRERERMDENGLPFLKDIPFVGYLFKSANKSVQKTDLMFFLRPTIINTLSPDGRNEFKGVELARDLTPAILEDGDADKANLRHGNHRKLGKSSKPAHYNENSRPKKPADVKPGA